MFVNVTLGYYIIKETKEYTKIFRYNRAIITLAIIVLAVVNAAFYPAKYSKYPAVQQTRRRSLTVDHGGMRALRFPVNVKGRARSAG